MPSPLLAVLDAETDPFSFGLTPKPFVWGLQILETQEYLEFWDDNLHIRHETCTDKLIEYLDKLDTPLRIYAHNGGKFDYFFLLKYLNPQLSLINGRVAECSIGDHILRDSWLILPIPLSQMDKGEIDYNKMKLGERHRHTKEISAYLYKDCDYLGKWVGGFIRRFGMKITLASTAFSELKTTDYKIGKTFEDYDNIFRKFYFGGRVQCFSVGEHLDGPYSYVDINSAYPRAMLDEHPSGPDWLKVFKPPSDYDGYFAEIVAISKGALPYRDPEDATKKLYFPEDDKPRIYRVTGWEIKAGLETNTLEILEYKSIYITKAKQNFKDYILKFYQEKLEADKNGDEESRLFSKLLMNSAYGKFGMDGRKFKDYLLMPEGEAPPLLMEGEELAQHQWHHYCDMETGETMFEKDNPKKDFYDVATAASITGWVRAFLWRAICSSKGVIYCDTDSIMCKKFSGVIGSELGEWSIEARLDQAYIAQRKMYAVRISGLEWLTKIEKWIKKGSDKDKKPERWKYACKGIPKKQLKAKDIVEGIKTGTNLLIEKEAPSFSLKHGSRFMAREIAFNSIEKSLQNSPD